MTLRRLIIAIYLLVFLSAAAASGVFFWQTRREYDQLLETQKSSKQHLAEMQAKLSEQEKVLQRLRTDPEYVEMVIRRRLGYAKPDEYIFRFAQ